jgi:hypothetical protein
LEKSRELYQNSDGLPADNEFRQVVGKPVVDKEVLRQWTTDYQNWVEAYARKSRHPDPMG